MNSSDETRLDKDWACIRKLDLASREIITITRVDTFEISRVRNVDPDEKNFPNDDFCASRSKDAVWTQGHVMLGDTPADSRSDISEGYEGDPVSRSYIGGWTSM